MGKKRKFTFRHKYLGSMECFHYPRIHRHCRQVVVADQANDVSSQTSLITCQHSAASALCFRLIVTKRKNLMEKQRKNQIKQINIGNMNFFYLNQLNLIEWMCQRLWDFFFSKFFSVCLKLVFFLTCSTFCIRRMQFPSYKIYSFTHTGAYAYPAIITK